MTGEEGIEGLLNDQLKRRKWSWCWRSRDADCDARELKMNAEKLVQLPISGSGCGDIRILSDGVELSVEYEYRADGADWVGAIHFSDCIAYRFHNEMHSKGYCSDGYDAIAEVKSSSWLAELIRDEPTGIRDAIGKKHFAVFLSSNGYLEVIADAFDLPSSRKGLLS